MALKDKLNKLKTVAMGVTMAATLTNCTDKQPEKEPVQDMLVYKDATDVDIYGNEVLLHKVDVPIYSDKSMKKEGYMQLLWGLDNNDEVSLRRSADKTHLEEYDLPNGDTFLVETYDDGVLKANNSLIVIDRKIQVVGDAKHYQENLNRRAADLQELANQAKRRKLEQIRAEERANAAKRKANVIAETEVQSDSLFVERDSVTAGDSVKNNSHKHRLDSLPLDTVQYIKNHKERE